MENKPSKPEPSKGHPSRFTVPFYIVQKTVYDHHTLADDRVMDVSMSLDEANDLAEAHFHRERPHEEPPPKPRRDSHTPTAHACLEALVGTRYTRVCVSQANLPVFAREGDTHLVWHLRYRAGRREVRGAAETVASREQAAQCAFNYYRSKILRIATPPWSKGAGQQGVADAESGRCGKGGGERMPRFEGTVDGLEGIVLALELAEPWSCERMAGLKC